MNRYKAFVGILVAELACLFLAFYFYGFEKEALQATVRFSGRLSLLYFSLLFLLSLKNNWLQEFLSPNPFAGFALAHGIHLVELLTYQYMFGSGFVPVRALGGFVAYVFIFMLPFFYSAYQLGKVKEKTFNIFNNIFLFYVWFVFFITYLPRVQGKLPNVGGSYQEFVILLSWVCMMLGMKITTYFSKPFKTQS
jgi:hypothetical protein